MFTEKPSREVNRCMSQIGSSSAVFEEWIEAIARVAEARAEGLERLEPGSDHRVKRWRRVATRLESIHQSCRSDATGKSLL